MVQHKVIVMSWLFNNFATDSFSKLSTRERMILIDEMADELLLLKNKPDEFCEQFLSRVETSH